MIHFIRKINRFEQKWIENVRFEIYFVEIA